MYQERYADRFINGFIIATMPSERALFPISRNASTIYSWIYAFSGCRKMFSDTTMGRVCTTPSYRHWDRRVATVCTAILAGAMRDHVLMTDGMTTYRTARWRFSCNRTETAEELATPL